ncbi:MAG: hypothetical protein FWD87_10925 [Spirochaetaceae bacterium]|nr:hypothetical protein [Spirochaetaceae bacterium]
MDNDRQELIREYLKRFNGKHIGKTMPDMIYAYEDKDGNDHLIGHLSGEELIALLNKGLETNTDILLEFPIADLSGKNGNLL